MSRIEMTATGTYLVWAGSGTKNDANAVFYIKNNGSAYFGGSLSAGVLRNSASSSAVSNSPSVQTPRFGTNGNSKTVTVSFSYSNAGITFDYPPAQALSITLVLERRRNGAGTWTQIGSSMTFTGATIHQGTEPGMGTVWSMNLSGSSNFTDNATGTQDFEYRVRRTASSGTWPFIISGPPVSYGTQNLSVTSVEN